MVKEFFRKYKKETRKNKLLDAKLILLNEYKIKIEELKKDNNVEKFNECMRLTIIIDDLDEYYKKIKKE